MMGFGCVTDYILLRIIFFLRGLSFRTNEFTEFTVKFDLKLGGKNRTDDNLTD